jgi:hypothetical protein
MCRKQKELVINGRNHSKPQVIEKKGLFDSEVASVTRKKGGQYFTSEA